MPASLIHRAVIIISQGIRLVIQIPPEVKIISMALMQDMLTVPVSVIILKDIMQVTKMPAALTIISADSEPVITILLVHTIITVATRPVMVMSAVRIMYLSEHRQDLL